jgi:hypothetical protein
MTLGLCFVLHTLGREQWFPYSLNDSLINLFYQSKIAHIYTLGCFLHTTYYLFMGYLSMGRALRHVTYGALLDRTLFYAVSKAG